MIRFNKRSLLWVFSFLFFTTVLIESWQSVQYIFSTPSDDNNTTPRPRYQRDYTTLTVYTVGLCLLYCILVLYQHSNFYLFNKNNSINRSRKSNNIIDPNIDTDAEVNKAAINNNIDNSPLSNNPQLYFLRRWWHREYRFLNTTFYVGHCIIVLGLIGIHIGFILGYFTLNGQWENDYERYLDYQLRSNRTAQLALVDLAMALALSVRSSVLWRWIGVSNLLTTLPLHKWFGRFSIICTIYHGCYQWTKHYYRQLERDHDNNNTLLQQHQYLSNDNEIKEAMMNWWTLLISNPRYFTGSIMGLCMFILLLGSHPFIRMKWYGFFRFSHLLGFFGILLAGGWHHWVFILFYASLVVFWLTDIVYRWYQSIPGSIMDLTPLSRNVVRLKLMVPNDQKKKQSWIQKHISLLPGQFVFLSFSNNKWKNVFWSHPFSISFIEHNESIPTSTNPTAGSGSVLTFYIKAFGNDTQYLYDLSANFKKNDWPTTLQLSAPYGDHIHTCQPKHIYAFYPVIVLVAEGIGITPWLSVLQSLWNTTDDNTINNQDNDDSYDSMKHIYLIWTLRHTDLIDPMINDVYTILNKQSTMMTFQLNWQIYITHDQDEVITSPPTNGLHRDDEHHHQQINIKYHHGRPNYVNILESIRSQHSQDHTILGLCAHEESIQLCGNLARSKRFNNNKAHWEVKSERFEF